MTTDQVAMIVMFDPTRLNIPAIVGHLVVLDGVADIELIPLDTLPDLEGPGHARRSDPATSRAAAHTSLGRKGSARRALLEAHQSHADAYHEGRAEHDDLTDEEACDWAGLSRASEYATRCSELRRLGLIAPTSHTREGVAGPQRIASRITLNGRLLLKEGT